STASSFTLTVAIGGSAGGTVTSSPPGVNCGSTCSSGYIDGTGQDSDIPVQSVVIKAVHVAELRSAIDTLRAVNHLAPGGWTDATLSPGSTPVESLYISDLRTALS